MKSINASEANRNFSRILREVAKGEAYTIISRGKAVASMYPAELEAAERRQAKSELLKRLNQKPVTGIRQWTREDLYK